MVEPDRAERDGYCWHDQGHRVPSSMTVPTRSRSSRSEQPDSSAAAVALREAAARLGRGQAPEAVAAYRRLLGTFPALPEAHHNLGVALRRLGRVDEAIAAYQHAISLRPGYAMAHHHLAQALEAASRPLDALKHRIQAFRLEADRLDFAQGL